MKTFYPAIFLTGVTDECLDYYDGDDLVDGDVGIVVTDTETYEYTLDATSGAAESSPDVIAPNTNPGAKRWILIKSYLRADGTIPLTADWDIGTGNTILADKLAERALADNLTLETFSGDGKVILSEDAVSYLTLSLRERDHFSGYDPDVTFSIAAGPAIKAASSQTALGDIIIFATFDTSYLSGKKIAITWQGTETGSGGTPESILYVVDGEYDRSVDADWGEGTDLPPWTKGNGIIHTLSEDNFHPFGPSDYTSPALNLAGASLSKVTVVMYVQDAWIANTAELMVSKFQVLSSGDALLQEVDFDAASLTMEKTLSFGDYGYFGSGGTSGYRGLFRLGGVTDLGLNANTFVKLQNSGLLYDSYFGMNTLDELIVGNPTASFEGVKFKAPTSKGFTFGVNDVENIFITATGLGIGIDPTYPLHLDHTPGDAEFRQIRMYANPTGTLTSSRDHYGISQALISYADRDGNTYNVFGGSFAAGLSGAAASVVNALEGLLSFSSGSATIGRAIYASGSINQAGMAEVDGVHSKILFSFSGETSNVYGMRSSISINSSGTIPNAYANYNQISQSSGAITTGYLFYGTYSGTIGTKWGLYLTGEDKNYFSGSVGIGNDDPGSYSLYVAGTGVGIFNAGETRGIGIGQQAEYTDIWYYNGSGWSTPVGISDTKSNLGAVDFYDGWMGLANLYVGTLETIGDAHFGADVGIGIAPSYPLHIRHFGTGMPLYAAHVDLDPTGTLTGSASNTGLYLNINSAVDRDGNNYVLTGMSCNVITSGSADVSTLYAFSVVNQHNTATALNVMYGIDISSSVTNGTISTMYGLRKQQTVSTNANVTTLYADYSNVQMSSAGNTLTSGYAYHAQVVQTAGTFTTGYVLYGTLSGTIGTKWGIFISGDDKNRFAGQLGLGVNPTYKLTILETAAAAAARGIQVNVNGSGTLTGTAEQHGIRTDVSTTADRDGNTYNVFGGEFNVSVDGGEVSNMYGIQTSLAYYGTSPVCGNAYGLYAVCAIQKADMGSVYGAYKSLSLTFDADATTLYGDYSNVSVNGASATISQAYGYYAAISRGNGTLTTGYLFRGSFSGTIGTAWGIYLSGEDKSYMSGTLGIGAFPVSGSVLTLGMATMNCEFIDSDTSTGTEDGWIEVEIGNATRYIRVHTTI